ncbi:chaperonin 10-like protein [Leptodontidium sp. 2 PMI_412]|nr:chaperonin 10-like protein [Leptodontidium sp. 2 PMI_412]
MKEAINHVGPKVEIGESSIPEPKDDQILIKTIASDTNLKDWKVTEFAAMLIEGDDIAGIIEKVGANVIEFKPGDRVAAFFEMLIPNGSYAEYAIAWGYTTSPPTPDIL